jgi:hypothetical protein
MKTLALNILDIAQNSIRAKATQIVINISESKKGDNMEISINDNGIGINKNMINKVTDPFITSRKTRRIGMGLPLLKYHAKIAGGDMIIKSQENNGTSVNATFSLSHFDRQPLGDIAGVMTILIAANPDICFLYSHTTDLGEYRFSSTETKEFLEVNTLNDYILLDMIKSMINENLRGISVSDMN